MREFVDTYPRGVGELAGDITALRGWARASHIDQGAFGYRDGMIFLGRGADGALLGLDDPGHCITVAESRAGKGVSVIVPNLCLYPGSAVVIDPKGENATLTAARRGQGSAYCEGMGQTVYVLDPFKQVPNHAGATYNPLSVFDPDTPEGRELAIDDAALIADALVTPGGERDSHWDESARSVLEALILHVVSTEAPETRTLTRVRELLMRGVPPPDSDPEGEEDPSSGFIALLEGPLRANNKDFDGVIAMAAEALLDLASAERGSILSTARRNTKFLDSPAMKRVLAHSAFDLRDLKRQAMTVYLCLPASRLHTHARWLRLMIGLSLALMERERTRPALPVLFFMDEFAALGKLDVIETAAGLMAGYGVKLWPILQDLSQLKRHYPQSWETFLGNAGLHQFFGNTDLTTLEHVSKRLGKTAVRTVTQSQNERAGTEGQGISMKIDTADLLRPDEVAHWFARHRGTQIVLLPGQHPWALRRVAYYEDPFFAGKRDWANTLPPPAPPTLEQLRNRPPPPPPPSKPRGVLGGLFGRNGG